jgi:hypothetical protein
MWRLLYTLHYFSLTNSEKRHLDAWPTIILGAVIAAPFIFVPNSNFFHEGGFLDKFLVLTAALTGFYVAALVAVATFPNPDMDKIMTVGAVTRTARGNDGKVLREENGKPVIEMLTRREFACAIFGYLAFSALILSIGAAVFVPLSTANLQATPLIGPIFGQPYNHAIRDCFVFTFSIGAAHLIVATCLGLYYLMVRVYRRDPQIVARKHDRAA